jgi:hypothetical protein
MTINHQDLKRFCADRLGEDVASVAVALPGDYLTESGSIYEITLAGDRHSVHRLGGDTSPLNPGEEKLYKGTVLLVSLAEREGSRLIVIDGIRFVLATSRVVSPSE